MRRTRPLRHRVLFESLEGREFRSVTPAPTPPVDVMKVLAIYRVIHAIVAPRVFFNTWVMRTPILSIRDENHDGRVDSADVYIWGRAMWNGFISPAAQAYWKGVR